MQKMRKIVNLYVENNHRYHAHRYKLHTNIESSNWEGKKKNLEANQS
jgi:hypothetical protein